MKISRDLKFWNILNQLNISIIIKFFIDVYQLFLFPVSILYYNNCNKMFIFITNLSYSSFCFYLVYKFTNENISFTKIFFLLKSVEMKNKLHNTRILIC